MVTNTKYASIWEAKAGGLGVWRQLDSSKSKRGKTGVLCCRGVMSWEPRTSEHPRAHSPSSHDTYCSLLLCATEILKPHTSTFTWRTFSFPSFKIQTCPLGSLSSPSSLNLSQPLLGQNAFAPKQSFTITISSYIRMCLISPPNSLPSKASRTLPWKYSSCVNRLSVFFSFGHWGLHSC